MTTDVVFDLPFNGGSFNTSPGSDEYYHFCRLSSSSTNCRFVGVRTQSDPFVFIVSAYEVDDIKSASPSVTTIRDQIMDPDEMPTSTSSVRIHRLNDNDAVLKFKTSNSGSGLTLIFLRFDVSGVPSVVHTMTAPSYEEQASAEEYFNSGFGNAVNPEDNLLFYSYDTSTYPAIYRIVWDPETPANTTGTSVDTLTAFSNPDGRYYRGMWNRDRNGKICYTQLYYGGSLNYQLYPRSVAEPTDPDNLATSNWTEDVLNFSSGYYQLGPVLSLGYSENTYLSFNETSSNMYIYPERANVVKAGVRLIDQFTPVNGGHYVYYSTWLDQNHFLMITIDVPANFSSGQEYNSGGTNSSVTQYRAFVVKYIDDVLMTVSPTHADGSAVLDINTGYSSPYNQGDFQGWFGNNDIEQFDDETILFYGRILDGAGEPFALKIITPNA